MEVLTKGIVREYIIIPESLAGFIDLTEVEIFLLNTADPVGGSWHDERTVEKIVKNIKDSHFPVT